MFRIPFTSDKELEECQRIHGVSKYVDSSSSECFEELDDDYYKHRPPSIFSTNRPINSTGPTTALFLNTDPPATESASIVSCSTKELNTNVLKEIALDTDGVNLRSDDNPEARCEQADIVSKVKQEETTKENVAIADNKAPDNLKKKLKPRKREPRMAHANKYPDIPNVNNRFDAFYISSTDEENEEELNKIVESLEQPFNAARRPNERKSKKKRKKKAQGQQKQAQEQQKQAQGQQKQAQEQQKKAQGQQKKAQGQQKQAQEQQKQSWKRQDKQTKEDTPQQKPKQEELPVLMYKVPETMKSIDWKESSSCLHREAIYNPYYFHTKLVCDVIYSSQQYSTSFMPFVQSRDDPLNPRETWIL